MKRVVSAPLLKLALQFLASSQIQMEASSSVVVISNAPEKISQHFEGGSSRKKTAVREKGRNFSFLSLRGENLEEFLFLSFSSVNEGRGTNREGPKVEREKEKSKKLYLDKWLGECLRAIP